MDRPKQKNPEDSPADSMPGPSHEELMELRRLAAIHRFLIGNLDELEARTEGGSDHSLDRIRKKESRDDPAK